ncbi:MAG: zf-HC2 domain-containing protein [Bacillota bacterium]|nr:zf-HC2 domain-containing protein [Bacillota bacterium]
MKLECAVVRDLYIPYLENELSPEVREAVEQHLGGCENCRHMYDSGLNFNDILKKDPDEQPSKKLDEKLMLRLKVSRLRVALIFIAAIFIITLYSNYSQSRYNLLYDVSQAEQTVRQMSFTVDDIKNDMAPIASLSRDIEGLNNQQNNAIGRDLNLVEKSQLKKVTNGLFMNFQVERLYYILKIRHMNGTFTNRDEKAATLFKKYIDDISRSMSDVRLFLNKLHDSGKLQALITPIDIKSIAEEYNKLNQLALLYTQYDKFPEELSPMSEEAVKARLKSIFKFDKPEIVLYPNLKESIALNGDCTFNIKQGSISYNGQIDAYTGSVKSFTNGLTAEKGELLPLDGVKDNLLKFLERMYGKEQSFDIEYAGINYNFSSNTDIKLYSFKVYPQIKGLRVDSGLWIYFDARTGNLFSMTRNSGSDFIVPDYPVDTSIKVSNEEALKNLNINDKEKYSYSETLIVKSKLSGKYVPVYLYKKDTNSVYVNTITGKQEILY